MKPFQKVASDKAVDRNHDISLALYGSLIQGTSWIRAQLAILEVFIATDGSRELEALAS